MDRSLKSVRRMTLGVYPAPGRSPNRSLLALGQVIAVLAGDARKHIPYRGQGMSYTRGHPLTHQGPAKHPFPQPAAHLDCGTRGGREMNRARIFSPQAKIFGEKWSEMFII